MKKQSPAYQLIKDHILKNIYLGVWQEGDVIPTEHALTEQFGVSRMTVNRALKELSEERILERKQGSGTFVAQQKYKNISVQITNIAQDIQASSRKYRTQVNSKCRLSGKQINPVLQSHFGLGPVSKASLLYEIKISHYADDEPVQYEERWVDASIVPEFIEQDFSRINTSDYLIRTIPFESGSYSIFAKPASAEVALALQIPENSATLLLQRSTIANNRVVTFVNLWHAGSRYQFSGQLI